MHENLELVLVGAADAPWYSWDHQGWYWIVGAHGAIWLALIIIAVAVLTRSTSRAPANSARSELDIRYARGEIDRGEYLERKRDLG